MRVSLPARRLASTPRIACWSPPAGGAAPDHASPGLPSIRALTTRIIFISMGSVPVTELFCPFPQNLNPKY